MPHPSTAAPTLIRRQEQTHSRPSPPHRKPLRTFSESFFPVFQLVLSPYSYTFADKRQSCYHQIRVAKTGIRNIQPCDNSESKIFDGNSNISYNLPVLDFRKSVPCGPVRNRRGNADLTVNAKRKKTKLCLKINI